LKSKKKEDGIVDGEAIVSEYFKLVAKKDMGSLLNLFAPNAVVYEPFSKSEGLRGRAAIEPFLNVVMMASEGLKRSIVTENQKGKTNKVTALVTFERGDRLKGKFTFELDSNSNHPGMEGKIKSLHIQFN
jgi:ketosteroid isomerase-like protein